MPPVVYTLWKQSFQMACKSREAGPVPNHTPNHKPNHTLPGKMLDQPLTDPIAMPVTKYFWTKGYRRIIGPVTMTTIAILMDSLGSFSAPVAIPISWANFALLSRSYR